jgi:hypothetical protein
MAAAYEFSEPPAAVRDTKRQPKPRATRLRPVGRRVPPARGSDGLPPRRARSGGLAGEDQPPARLGRAAERAPDSRFTVVHHIRGRVRLRVPPLRHRPALGDHLIAFLTRQPGIRDAHATSACASLTVSYDPVPVDVAQIETWVCTAMASLPATTRQTGASARPSVAVPVGHTYARSRWRWHWHAQLERRNSLPDQPATRSRGSTCSPVTVFSPGLARGHGATS